MVQFIALPNRKSTILITLILLSKACLEIAGQQTSSGSAADLQNNFLLPPVSARSKVLWAYVKGNVSLSQVTFEWEDAKRKGATFARAGTDGQRCLIAAISRDNKESEKGPRK